MNINKTIATGGIAGLMTVAMLSAPAFAASLKITQQGENGGTNPPSHITVVDDVGTMVTEFDYEGGSAVIDPVDVEVGKTYTVDAIADGYDFRAQSGTITQDATFPVELTAIKASTLIIQFKADGVSDYSGISASLYQGADTSGQPKATATTDASGKITFNSVPHGDYTMRIVLPATLSSTGFASNHVITIPEEGEQTITVTIEPEKKLTEQQPAAEPEPQKEEPKEEPKEEVKPVETVPATAEPSKPVNSTPAKEAKASGSTKDPISQTGDAIMGNLVGMSAIAIALSSTILLARRFRRNRE